MSELLLQDKICGGVMVPVQITFRDVPSTPALETHIRKKADKLNQYFDRISSCRIVVELPQKHKHQGKIYQVRIDVTVPGKEFVVTHKKDEDIYVAIRDSFDAISRQLEEHGRKRHGHVKTHESVAYGYVERIIQNEGYGFIEGVDGNQYYFSLTNLANLNFEQLVPGAKVEFLAVPLNDGWQAHKVRVIHNHHE